LGTLPKGAVKVRSAFALLVGIIVALGLCGVPSAFAANPDVIHFTETFSETDDNFCGTGQTVESSTSLRVTVFLAPNQPVDSRTVAQVKVVYTNPENDATVLRHAAGPSSDTAISGDPEGAHEVTLVGLVTQLRAATAASCSKTRATSPSISNRLSRGCFEPDRAACQRGQLDPIPEDPVRPIGK
jgi:hypothetical protein